MIEKIFKESGVDLFLVGGSVRDILLGITPSDLDYTTPALPEEVISILKHAGLPVIPIGIKFGTVATIIDGQKVEITTFRTAESYKKGNRKPDVVFGKDLSLDLSRRDFTINAIAKKGNEYIDPFGGIRNLNDKILDTPIDPIISFSDDPLRILRGARFISKYNLTPTDRVANAAKECADQLLNVSVERVFEEFTKLLCVDDPTNGLQFLAKVGAIAVLFPEIQKCIEFKKDQGKYHYKKVWEHLLDVISNVPTIPHIRWAALLHDVAKPLTYSVINGDVHFYGHEVVGAKISDNILKKYKASNKFRKKVVTLVRNHMVAHYLSEPHVTDKALRRFINKIGDNELLFDLVDLNRGDLTSKRKEKLKRLLRYNDILRNRLLKITHELSIAIPKPPKGFGKELIDVGIPKGPVLGKVINIIKEELVSGDLTLEDDLVERALAIYSSKILTDEPDT